MQNIGLIIAGGSGARMHQNIPKQFLNVYDKPVIIYTLEAFQRHPNIDGIVVVCIEGWEKILDAYCKQFNISKLENIVTGGQNGQDSIRNGVYDIASRHSNDDLILIHDAIRPMVSEEIISDCIRVASANGNAISVVPCTAAMLKTNDGKSSSFQVPRDNLKTTQTPQCASVGTLVDAHKEALSKGITASVATCTMFIELGKTLYFSLGSEKNIKLTTTEDLDIFKALLNSKRSEWLK
ncbi:MAG: 2-C-methyl-D-erythritol 4-phosphate cytidylyltransferase [Bacteroidales bacterium]|nr:2-C-methyl-D-erythritol 4-phosphate cytidylyltransferase [Bacteroidales bacterium]MCC8155652.1 2-C-methyl-D-erythritol 4-phosphate cytidylyltransferase [Tannerellaceae bacterium]